MLGMFALDRGAVEPQRLPGVIREPAIGYRGLTEERAGDLIIVKLLESNRLREARLRQYSVPGTYRVRDEKGAVRAEAMVVLRYRAPDTKEFTVVSEKGSGLIRSAVFKPLMEVEVDTAAGRSRYDSSITPNNYSFKLLGEEKVEGMPCFVVQAAAKRADKYLFNGKVWIHAIDFAVVQIAGQPAQNPSIWITRVDFVRRYQKVEGFWLPLNGESRAQVRIFGINLLTIDYGRYQISRADNARAGVPGGGRKPHTENEKLEREAPHSERNAKRFMDKKRGRI